MKTEQATQQKSIYQKALRTIRRRERAKSGPGNTVAAALARGPHGARKSGRPTGRPSWWAAMKQESAAKKHLSNVPPMALDAVSERLGTRLAEYGIESVYGLSTASLSQLLDVPHVGAVTLRRIHKELTGRGIPVKWEVPA